MRFFLAMCYIVRCTYSMVHIKCIPCSHVGLSFSVYVLPLRAVAVHAAISRLSAGLPVHGRPSPRVLHSHARLHAPLDAAAAGLTRLLTC